MKKILLGAGLLCLILAGGICGLGRPWYTAGKGLGSATGHTALKALGELYGGSRVEKLAELSGLSTGKEPVRYLLENSVFILDADYMEKRVSADQFAMESIAQMQGCSYAEYITLQRGYESVDAYEQECYQIYERFVKERLAVYEAAKRKNIVVSTTEYQELLPKYAERFGYGEDVRKFEQECDKDSIAKEMLYDKTIERLQI